MIGLLKNTILNISSSKRKKKCANLFYSNVILIFILFFQKYYNVYTYVLHVLKCEILSVFVHRFSERKSVKTPAEKKIYVHVLTGSLYVI